jgi:hypothetical protein
VVQKAASIAWLLLLVAIAMPAIFLEYRVQEMRVDAASPDYIPYGDHLILPLGYATIPAETGSALSRYKGRISAERGIYGRSPFPRWAAVVCGVLAPLGLVVVSGFIALGRRSS